MCYVPGTLKNQITRRSSNSPIKHPRANSFLIYPPKSQLSACPLYTNDSDDTSLPNTDTSLLSRYMVWWGGGRRGLVCCHPGRGCNDFLNAIRFVSGLIQFDMVTFVVRVRWFLFNNGRILAFIVFVMASERGGNQEIVAK